MKFHKHFPSRDTKLYLLENKIDRAFFNSQFQHLGFKPFTFDPNKDFTSYSFESEKIPLSDGFDVACCIGNDIEQFSGLLGFVKSEKTFSDPDLDELDYWLGKDTSVSVLDAKIAPFDPDAKKPILNLINALGYLPYEYIAVELKNVRHNDSDFVKDILKGESFMQFKSEIYLLRNKKANMYKDAF
jgi:hypothetical protein